MGKTVFVAWFLGGKFYDFFVIFVKENSQSKQKREIIFFYRRFFVWCKLFTVANFSENLYLQMSTYRFIGSYLKLCFSVAQCVAICVRDKTLKNRPLKIPKQIARRSYTWAHNTNTIQPMYGCVCVCVCCALPINMCPQKCAFQCKGACVNRSVCEWKILFFEKGKLAWVL